MIITSKTVNVGIFVKLTKLKSPKLVNFLWTEKQVSGIIKNIKVIKEDFKVFIIPMIIPMIAEFTPKFQSDFSLDGVGITRIILNPDRVTVLGVPGLESGIDWLRITGIYYSFQEMEAAASLFLDEGDPCIFTEEESYSAGPGATQYQYSIFSPYVRGGYNYDPEFNQYTLCIDLNGSYCSSKSLHDMYSLLYKARHEHGLVKCSRVDLRIDDYTFQIIPYTEMYRAYMDDNIFHVRKFKPFREYLGGQLIAYGDYYGSRNSGTYTRVYVHEHTDVNNNIDCHSMRWESEFKRNHAQIIYDILTEFDCTHYVNWDDADKTGYIFDERKSINSIQELPALSEDELMLEFSKLIASLCIGSMDFRDKSGFSDRSKASVRDSSRLPFWQNFIDYIGSHLRFRKETVPRSLPKVIAWLFRQCSSSLAILRYGLGKEDYYVFLDLIAEYAQQNLRGFHIKQIKAILNHPNAIYDICTS